MPQGDTERGAAEPHQTLVLVHCSKAKGKLQKASARKSVQIGCEQHCNSSEAPGRLQIPRFASDWTLFSSSSVSRTISKQVDPNISLSKWPPLQLHWSMAAHQAKQKRKALSPKYITVLSSSSYIPKGLPCKSGQHCKQHCY